MIPARPAPFEGPVTREKVDAQIEAWQDLMGPLDYVVRYSPSSPGADNRGRVSLAAGKRLGVLTLQPDMPDDQVDRTIVHELLHCYIAGLEIAVSMLKEYTSAATDKAFDTAWDHAEHYMIERLTDLISGIRLNEFSTDTAAEWREAFDG